MSDARTYSIGEFARLGGVTAKALRHYDRVGVMRPSIVDRRTRYRRYTADQLPALYEVLALSRLGLSLRHVREALGERGDHSLSDALRAAKRAIETRVAEDRARLAWIDRRLGDLDGFELTGMIDAPTAGPAVVLKAQPPVRVLALRERLSSYDEADELLESLARGVDPVRGAPGMRGAVWHDCGARTGFIDCEAVVTAALGANRRRPSHAPPRLRELPAATLACVVHRGSDESSPATYAAAHRWIASQGLTIAGPNREWYLGSAGGSPLTEIQVPVTRTWHRERRPS